MLIVLNHIALFRQGKADHLQGRRKEYLSQARPILAQLEAFGHRSDNLLVDRAVRIERDDQRKMVASAIAAVDQFFVITVAANDAGLRQACGQHTLCQHSGKSPEQVACAKMQPSRCAASSLAHCINIILRQAIPFPGRIMFDAFFCQFHKAVTSFQRTEYAVHPYRI